MASAAHIHTVTAEEQDSQASEEGVEGHQKTRDNAVVEISMDDVLELPSEPSTRDAEKQVDAALEDSDADTAIEGQQQHLKAKRNAHGVKALQHATSEFTRYIVQLLTKEPLKDSVTLKSKQMLLMKVIDFPAGFTLRRMQTDKQARRSSRKSWEYHLEQSGILGEWDSRDRHFIGLLECTRNQPPVVAHSVSEVSVPDQTAVAEPSVASHDMTIAVSGERHAPRLS
ncbi:hypothetical protein JB92DRAFT_3138852 [Gautieria morchelliformis]|nr:hypothetical protein JB92DRAFT_3138852 [Gautieria morchelliformis]